MATATVRITSFTDGIFRFALSDGVLDDVSNDPSLIRVIITIDNDIPIDIIHPHPNQGDDRTPKTFNYWLANPNIDELEFRFTDDTITRRTDYEISIKPVLTGRRELAPVTFTLTIEPPNEPPTLAVNEPLYHEGAAEPVTLTSEQLSATDPNEDPADEIVYTIKTLPTGTFELQSTSDNSWGALQVNDTFTQADINEGRVRYTAATRRGESSFTFTVDDSNTDNSDPTTETFNIRYRPPPLVTTDSAGNAIDAYIVAGGSISLRLFETIPEDVDTSRNPGAPDNLYYSHFHILTLGTGLSASWPGQAITLGAGIFATDELLTLQANPAAIDRDQTLTLTYQYSSSAFQVDGIIQHINSPIYTVRVHVTVNDAPVLHTNTLTLHGAEMGRPIILSERHLYATDEDVADTPADITYTLFGEPTDMNNLEVVNAQGLWVALSAGSTFTQADVNARHVRYTPNRFDDGVVSIVFTVDDGNEDNSAPHRGSLRIHNPRSTTRTENNAPTLTKRDLQLADAEPNTPVTLTETYLRARDADTGDDSFADIVYTVRRVPSAGTLEVQNTVDGTWVTVIAFDTFSQADIMDARVRYTPDGDLTPTYFTFTVDDGNEDDSTPAIVTFHIFPSATNTAPTLERNQLFVNGAEATTPIVLGANHLRTTDADVADTPDQITYTIKTLPTGTLELQSTSDNSWRALQVNDTFTQADINAGRVRYTQAENFAPTRFTFTVDDGNEDNSAPLTETFHILYRKYVNAPGTDKAVTLTRAATVETGHGKDTIRGSTGNDRINAGLDDDIIELDTDDSAATADGADEVVYEVAEDDAGFTARSGGDIIRGFKPGDDQLIFKFTTPAPSGKTPLEVFLEGVNDKFHVRPLVDDGVVGLLFLFPESILLAGGRLSGSLLFLYFDKAYTVDAFKELIRTEGASDISDMANLDIDPLTFNITTSRALKAIFAGARDGTGGLGAETGAATIPPEDFSVTVADGPVLNAKVYVDINDNGMIDPTDILIGTTDATGTIRDVPARYAGRQLLADLNGATDTYTGEAFTQSTPIYKATAPLQTSANNGLVLSPLTTAIADLVASDKSEELALQLLFGDDAPGITMADLYNADNYIPPANAPTNEEERKQQMISQKSIEIHLLYEEAATPTEAMMRLANGFDPMEDLNAGNRDLATTRFDEAKARADNRKARAGDSEAVVSLTNANGVLEAMVTDADHDATQGALDVTYKWYRVVTGGDDTLLATTNIPFYTPGAARLAAHGLIFTAKQIGEGGNGIKFKFEVDDISTDIRVSTDDNGVFIITYNRIRTTREHLAEELNKNSATTGFTVAFAQDGSPNPFHHSDAHDNPSLTAEQILAGGSAPSGDYYVRITSTDSRGGTTTDLDSNIVTVNIPPTGTVAITQEAGGYLRADASGITDADDSATPTLAYQWYSGSPSDAVRTPIAGATGQTFTPITEGGQSLEQLIAANTQYYVIVTATDAHNNAAEIVSPASAVADSEAKGMGTISRMIDGSTYTFTATVNGYADPDDDDQTPNSLTYQWYRVVGALDSATNGESDDTMIAGETEQSLTVEEAVAAKASATLLGITVTAKDPGPEGNALVFNVRGKDQGSLAVELHANFQGGGAVITIIAPWHVRLNAIKQAFDNRQAEFPNIELSVASGNPQIGSNNGFASTNEMATLTGGVEATTGGYYAQVTVVDSVGGETLLPTVRAGYIGNEPPAIDQAVLDGLSLPPSISLFRGVELSTITLNLHALFNDDSDADSALTFAVEGLPMGISFDASTPTAATISGTIADAATLGDYEITLTATDSAGLTERVLLPTVTLRTAIPSGTVTVAQQPGGVLRVNTDNVDDADGDNSRIRYTYQWYQVVDAPDTPDGESNDIMLEGETKETFALAQPGRLVVQGIVFEAVEHGEAGNKYKIVSLVSSRGNSVHTDGPDANGVRTIRFKLRDSSVDTVIDLVNNSALVSQFMRAYREHADGRGSGLSPNSERDDKEEGTLSGALTLEDLIARGDRYYAVVSATDDESNTVRLVSNVATFTDSEATAPTLPTITSATNAAGITTLMASSEITDSDHIHSDGNIDRHYQWYKVVGAQDTAENGETNDIMIKGATGTRYTPGYATRTVHGITFTATQPGTFGNAIAFHYRRAGSTTYAVYNALEGGPTAFRIYFPNSGISLGNLVHHLNQEGHPDNYSHYGTNIFINFAVAEGVNRNTNNFRETNTAVMDDVVYKLQGGLNPNGAYYVRVSTTDSVGGYTRDVATSAISATTTISGVNAPPEGTATITQGEGKSLTVDASNITDPEGDDFTLAYRWYRVRQEDEYAHDDRHDIYITTTTQASYTPRSAIIIESLRFTAGEGITKTIRLEFSTSTQSNDAEVHQSLVGFNIIRLTIFQPADRKSRSFNDYVKAIHDDLDNRQDPNDPNSNRIVDVSYAGTPGFEHINFRIHEADNVAYHELNPDITGNTYYALVEATDSEGNIALIETPHLEII